MTKNGWPKFHVENFEWSDKSHTCILMLMFSMWFSFFFFFFKWFKNVKWNLAVTFPTIDCYQKTKEKFSQKPVKAVSHSILGVTQHVCKHTVIHMQPWKHWHICPSAFSKNMCRLIYVFWKCSMDLQILILFQSTG